MDEKYWMEYRKKLTKQLKQSEINKKENNYNSKQEISEAIINMAQQIGVKATARYFNITAKTVRYWLKKLSKN